MIRIIKKMSVWAILGSVLFMVIQIISDLYLPTLTSNIIDKGVTQGDSKYILQVGMIMIGVSLIGIVASLVNTLIATREGQKIGKKLRSEIYETVSYSSLESFDKVGTASLITRTTNDVNQVQMVTQMFLRLMINAPITLIGASFLAYTRDPELTKIFLYIIPSLIIIVGIVMYFAIPLFKTLQEKTDKLNLVFREGLTGVRVIRAFNKTPFEEKRFFNANKDYTQTAVRVNILMSFLMPVITLIISITNVSIIWYGGHNVAQGTLEVGNMMAFMTYAMQILMSFMMMTMIFVLVPRAQASAVRINEVLDMNKEKELTNDQQIKKEVPTLDFNDICFRYKGAEKPALLGVDFHLKAGETLAIIGGTGSGKTSLVNLIPRFYDIEKGSILFNEQNVQDLDVKELRNRVGFVPQKAILFTGTIRSNLLYGLENATEEEMWKALEIAQAKDFVEKLPDGLDSKVEQGGDNFSGGQKQRLAIARALIKPADIYIFETDALLRKALKENVTDAMIVIVAQRISTVVGADQIIVLDEGLMVGKGNHQELKETNETYQDIIKSQLREEEIA
jgi:ATP-binding cassette subfamily B protein